MAISFSGIWIGVTSPYPTVAIVDIAQYIDVTYLLQHNQHPVSPGADARHARTRCTSTSMNVM